MKLGVETRGCTCYYFLESDWTRASVPPQKGEFAVSQ
jgi:hypothetical protein